MAVSDDEHLRTLQERAENPPSIDAALVASKELVEALGPLAAEAPARYQAQLAIAWKLRGTHLGLTADQAEAEEAFATAVRLLRELSTGTNPESLYTLATSLIDLAEHRLKRDGAQEALGPIEEVRDLGRRLAREGTDAAQDLAAHASRLHALALQKLGDHQAAVEQAEQAQPGLERLERRDPDGRVLLAENHRTLALSLLELNRLKEARNRFELASWLFRRLSKREPEIFTGEQADVTLMIATIWLREGKQTRAVGNFEAAIQLYRDAARYNPTYEEDYRNAVTTLLDVCQNLGRSRDYNRILRKYPIRG
jgi:tetratricopeptide (TPR) repeat protein